MPSSDKLWTVFSTSLTFLAIFLLLILYFPNSITQFPPEISPLHSHNETSFSAPRLNVWDDLKSEEVVEILKFLHAEPNRLNLTAVENATNWDNIVREMEVLRPNKTDVLPFINGDSSNCALPPRWARVTVLHGATTEAGIYEYMVGPLPVGNDTDILPLTYCYNSGRNYSPVYIWADLEALQQWMYSELLNVSDIVLDLLGLVVDTNKTRADGLFVGPRRFDLIDGRVISWGAINRNPGPTQAVTILPQNLYINIDTTGRDPSKWRTLKWMYNSIYYNSAEELRAAWKRPGFVVLPKNLDGDWTSIEDFGEIPERDDPPPVMIQPYSPRYKLDREEKFVSWMGFEFYMAYSQVDGITLYDVRYKGERIIYELGLQEAMAYYAGDDPIQGGKVWLDTLFGMGGLMFELLPGYDCPIYASYLDAKYHRDESTSIRKNSICLFEYTSDAPLQRHTSEFYVTVSRNTYFVVRFISTVGNYDYTFDYIFYLDGSIEVKVRASGYISAAYWPDSSTQKVGKRYEYGYRVHDQLATSMHDHVLNFKVDMDINGTANTLMRVGIEPTTKSYKWETGSGPRNSMHLTQQPLTREKGLNWPPNGAEMFILYNTNSTNKWGEPRGYQIRPGTGMGNPIHSTISDTVITEQTAAWSTHDLWALKQHDTEPRSASAWNWIFPSSPLVDFSKFVNDEAILQEDIVLYVNLGGHHIPTTQDIPNTHMHTSSSSFMLIPHNFFDRDPSRKSAQGVKLELESDGNHTVRYYGGHYAINETVVVDSEGGGEAVLEADLKLYSATRNPVRKFPWNQTVGGGGVGFGWV